MDIDLRNRIKQYRTLSLPGQPMGMHMGTSYLINDLENAIDQLEAENEELLEMVRRCRPFINFSSPNRLADEIDKLLEAK